MSKKQQKQGGGNRKKGRNKDSISMKRYVAEGRLAKNKARRIAKAQRERDQFVGVE